MPTRSVLAVILCAAAYGQTDARFAQARENGKRFEEAVATAQRVLKVWLSHADPKTLLLPDRPLPDRSAWLYTPHNSGADLYPYLIVTAHLTDPDLYRGRMMEMLRNEIRYTTVEESIPANLYLESGKLGPASLFGAGEYAKDGLITVTEYLGRTPWYYRMVDMTADAMNRAPVESRFGKLPASDAELNGDYLQTLARMETMTGDKRFVEWARRIADAYMDEVLPGNHGVPSGKWDFQKHTGDGRLRLRDHGNEAVVGLVMQFTLENCWQTERAKKWRPAIAKMLDRILESANEDGLLYNEVDSVTLKPVNKGLSDNWGYVYAAVYSFYQSTGETKYRDAVRRVLKNLPKYRNVAWEPGRGKVLGSFDGYADSIEGAIYLANREAVPEAFDWIDSEMKVMLAMQRPDGHIEDWYGEGNFNRTALLHAFLKSQGVRPSHWTPGVSVGAVREGGRLYMNLKAPAAITVLFDFARHRRVLNFDQNYARLNEFPEWYTVDENSLYKIRKAGAAAEQVVLGSKMIAGIAMEPGDWIVESMGKAPYARQ